MQEDTSFIIRVKLDKTRITFGETAFIIGNHGGDVVAVDVIEPGEPADVRDITVRAAAPGSTDEIVGAIERTPGLTLVHLSDRTFLLHLGGKIGIAPKVPIKNRDDLSRVYTPGVAKVSMAIWKNPELSYNLTIRKNTVAVVSDGTAVLGLGDIGPYAAMPVMEGKAMLFKQLADIDAFPLCLNTKDPDEIVRIVRALGPSFGGINLEDIASPRCFEIEKRLIEELDIPVFHDDQHGTAIVVLAGLLNALACVDKKLEDVKIVVCGIGAAGIACTELLLEAGARNIIGVDVEGSLHQGRAYGLEIWNEYAKKTNPNCESGTLADVIGGADVFIGLSRPGVLTVENILRMAPDPIVFAMANPVPEISPQEGSRYAKVFATGRSDYPNQLNNVLAFPGVFRAALDCRARAINKRMEIAAAYAIASVVAPEERNPQYIIPGVFNDRVVPAVRRAVVAAAIESGLSGKTPRDFRTRERGGENVGD